MNLIERAKQYEKAVDFIYDDKSNVTLKWIAKYPFTCKHRRHTFQIIKDILRSKKGRVLDQGGAEGITACLLTEEGFKVLVVDEEPKFKRCWEKLDVNGVVGDCGSLSWWDGNSFEVIIAGVWAACKGDEGSMTADKKEWICHVRDNWSILLSQEGILYFDVNIKKYPIKAVKTIMEEKFSVNILKKKPRLLLKCYKYC